MRSRRTGSGWRIVRRLFGCALLLVLLLAGGVFLYLRTSLPQVEGSVAVKGLHGAVTIARDSDGVPLITAGDDEDAVFGLGFAHAQDRLFQMETMRRYGAGRLSEIFGEAALGIDRQMRVLGMYRVAEAEFAHLSAPVQRGLEAYAAGVNAFVATRHGPFAALPPEFLIFRFAPEPWKPADLLVWGKSMDLELAGNYRNELLRSRLARSMKPEELAFLYPNYPKDGPTTLAALGAIYRQLPLDTLYAALPPLDVLGPIYASNNWVVDGAHSNSGKPLLANDPHLAFGTPGFWYLARIRTPQREMAGGTAPGAPFVVLGHNDKISWGFTTTSSDVEDLFIEKIDPADPTHYLTPEGSEPFITRQETIAVRGAAPVVMQVRTTRHGPVLSDALPTYTGDPGYVLAFAATFLVDDDRTPDALWNLNRAGDWNEFRAALEDFLGPQQNMVFADTGGTIGFIAPARVPIRKNGDGWLPMPGWTGEYDWTGYIPFADLPQASNPPTGHFISANNQIVPSTYRYFLSRDWDIPDRAERIGEMLAARPTQSPAASAAMQADNLSIAARHLVPLMTRIAPESDIAREAVDRLRDWDFRMEADKVEPLLFGAWLRAFARDVQVGHLGKVMDDAWDLKPLVMQAVLTGHPEWCGPPEKPPANCNALLASTLEGALAELSRAYGGDMTQWQWGRAHVALFPNAVYDRIPVVKDLLHVSVPVAGGFDTVNRGATTVRDPAHPFEQRFGAGLRIITDMAAPTELRMIATPGQSGNPLSPHFSDLLRRWRQFEYLAPGKATPVATLTLEPAK